MLCSDAIAAIRRIPPPPICDDSSVTVRTGSLLFIPMNLFGASGLATIQYHGSHYTTQSCLDAIARLLSAGAVIKRALLLTHEAKHGFYLDVQDPEPICIRCGFTSGYSGEGPAGLAIALHLFRRFEIEVEEVLVSDGLLTRINENRLTEADLGSIVDADIVRPIRTDAYKYDGLQHRGRPGPQMREQFAPVVPWFALDDRLIDLAIVLSRDPDKAVFEAFRRLESLVKKRCEFPLGLAGSDVFKKAFRGSGAVLTWRDVSRGEIEGRAQMFEAAFMAYRNPRAHREEVGGEARAYREFYVANELFLLEAEAVKEDPTPA